MVSGFISRLVILIFGTLYPAYASYKAVRTKNVKEYVKWMMYWIVFALFTCAETFTDLFLSFWFPFYYEIKIITVIYLLSPATKGSSILYRKFVHPVLIKREQEIDEYIAKAKEQGYHTMLNLGSKGVNYATSLIMQTAIKGLPNLPLTPSSDFLPAKNIDAVDPFDLEDDCNNFKDWGENSVGKGGGGLVNQLRKSYSLSDLRGEENESITDGGGSKLTRRIEPQNSEQVLPENRRSFYYPDDGFYMEPIAANSTRQSKGDVLVRTASLGPSSRIRTRAVTKNGFSKRASLSEGGSTRSAVESHESQNETDNFTPPFPHSMSYPFPLTSVPPYFVPEYQHMVNNIIHNQMFAFITDPESYAQVLGNRTVAFQNDRESGSVCQNDETSGNPSVCISEENSDCIDKIKLESDGSDLTREIRSSETAVVNPTAENSKGKEEIVVVSKTVEKKETAKENLLPFLSDSPDDREERAKKKRCGKYKKKPAPTPPTEPHLIVDDEESVFFTPNVSPVVSRKPSLSDLEILHDSDKCKANIVGDVSKKSNKIKKGDVNISKRLNIPKFSFSFWHQKPEKLSSNSTVSVESASTISEIGSSTEFFVPLKDNYENKGNQSNLKEGPHVFGD